MSFDVIQPGLLSLLQDSGRSGQHRIGLTNGGPLDPQAFNLCNRLLQNPEGSTAIEIGFGGLQLKAQVDTFICLCGADMPLHVNDEELTRWQVHRVKAGDTIDIGFAQRGCRAYLGVADGFTINPQFGSTATVMREHIGGINGDKLQVGDTLPCADIGHRKALYLAAEHQPEYTDEVSLRVLPGYQVEHFSRLQQRRFFSSQFTVSDRCDRMGFRLEGPAIDCDIEGILSEGICFGAVQIPADGQPIVLLNDRQTIGGYPKIGSVLSLDAARLTQLRPGARVQFCEITACEAHNALNLAERYYRNLPLLEAQP